MSIAEGFDAFLLDLDGVVWRGETPIPGAAETIDALRDAGKRVLFVTNNSSRTPREYAVKLMRMKVPTATQDVVTSGHAVAEELRRRGSGEGDRIHVCGGEGLMTLLRHERFVPTREADGDIKAVVVGWNPRGTFEDIRKASDLARAGVPLIASNADATYPTEGGVLPGTGALLAAIRTASGVEGTVVGKPEPALFRIALARAGTPPERTLFCGDRPETDLVGAKRAGLPAALMLSGVTAESDLGRLPEVPDVILDDLGELLGDLPLPRTERADGAVLAMGDGELARVECSRNGSRVRLDSVSVPKGTDRRVAWNLLRRLLLEALDGAEEVDAAPQLRPYLERLGVDTGPQPRLFTP